LVLGCATTLEEAVVGRYHGELDITAVSSEHRKEAERAATLVSGALLEIKEGGKAKVSGMGQSGVGSWRLEGNRLILSLPDHDANLTFEVREYGKRLVPIFERGEDRLFMGAKVQFKKE
jgi:hypothetical protein